MPQVPILNGIYSNESADFRSSYPRNMVPVPKSQGISQGYLRPGDGIVSFGTGPGVDRGGINWNGICYRVMGSNLVSVNEGGSVNILGTVAGSEQVRFDYSFDRLAIAAGGNLYYWNGILTQVIDPDLGRVLDVQWIDGYFVTTDGTSLVVTELNDPTSVNPLKYGSSEADPDPIVGVRKWRGELYAFNRYTVEVFDNVGGSFFPFQRNPGAKMERGAIGPHCVVAGFLQEVAFLGGGRNESPAIWLGANGGTDKLSTREIDQILQQYSESELSKVVMETRVDKNHELLYIHLPDRTVVYDASGSKVTGEPVWFHLDSGIFTPSTYRARNLVWCYDKWLSGDPTSSALGYLNDSVSTHYGQVIGWEFGTVILYNEGLGAIFHQLELTCLPGRVPLGANPIVWTSFSVDGEGWSKEVAVSAGKQGERNKRLIWLRQGSLENMRIQKFRGTSDAFLSVARLDIQLEPLYTTGPR